MSKHFAQSRRAFLHGIQLMSTAELEALYNIEIDDYGYVWDPCESWTFDSVREWANHMWEQEQGGDEHSSPPSKPNKAVAYDDY